MTHDFSFHCSACGKCCNSPPQASLPELLHHQHRFVGCLTVRRVRPMHAGGASPEELALFRRVLHPLAFSSEWIQLATAAYDDGSERCPGLDAEGRCTVHGDRKPAVCSAVPLEAWRPDGLQEAVLEQRQRQAVFLGADCIVSGTVAPTRALPLVRGGRVVDDASRDALARRREDLQGEKQLWGDAVFQSLTRDLFTSAVTLARVPPSGYLSLSIAPVLLQVAAISERCRLRCLEYVEAQSVLLGTLVRKPSAARQLHAFLKTHVALGRTLRTARDAPKVREIDDAVGACLFK